MSRNNSLTQAPQQPKFSAAISSAGYQKLILNTLGDPERAKRFVAAITSAVSVNPALQECTNPTIVAGALLGESLNLSPSPQLGQYYLVPFNCKVKDEYGNETKEKRAQFVLGYKGYLQMALRSGQYADLDVMEIHEGEYSGKDPKTGKPRFSFIEDDDERENLPIIGYYAYFEYLNGFVKGIYWTKQKMLNHADQYSSAFSAITYQKLQNGEIPDKEKWKYSSFWYKDFDAMARKTLLRQLISKWGVMSTELQNALTKDAAVIDFKGNDLIAMPEEQLTPALPTQPDAPVLQPEASNIVDQIDLSDL